ncbi:helix-turn-helix domain-containing protein [Streptomyces sp. NPDC052773]|uniref:helix-turn-helix domain-containing protein n=1 Tax=Streptomyces sp. NPDC052773 TaxID=3365693 RepID=UPI0037D83558
MSVIGKPPTVRRRRLAAELRRLRKAAELSHEEVTEQTGISRTTLYRIESARVTPQPRTVITLLDTYRVGDAERGEIIELAKVADTQGWTRPYHADLRESLTAYIAFEAEASGVRNYQSLFIPGLLQTEQYARAVIPGVWPSATTKDIDQHVQARMERQALLTKDNPLDLTVVIDEAALRRCVGGPAVMAEQMQRLQVAAKQPHVSVQVIPYAVGAHPGMPGSFSLLSFPDPDYDELVYIDSMAGDVFLESEADISQYTNTFNTLRALALSPDDSLSMIATAMHDLTREQETA